MRLLFSGFVFASLLFNQNLWAEDIAPTLGKKGKELLSEKFEGNTIPQGWAKNVGAMKIQDGALRISELASDKHVGAFRKALPIQNMTVQVDFMMDGGKMFNVGFDPAAGELKKKGHLYAVAITANNWSLSESNDKANPDSKAIAHAKGNLKLEPGKWYTLMLENKGEDVVVTIAGQGSLKAKASDFKVKKPGLIFRAGGPDTAGVMIDNVQVHELE
jgi:hypothetical protein